MRAVGLWPRLLVAAVILAALAGVPRLGNDSITFVAGLALIEAVFALSWNLLFNYTGIASFGHAAFFAIGAYVVAVAQRHGWNMPFLLQQGVAFALGGALAFAVGAVALKRASGIHLAILTLAVAEVLRMLIGYSTYLGREDGISGIPRPVLDFGFMSIRLQAANAYYWFIVVTCAMLALCLWWLVSSRYGRVLRSIAQDADRASFVGINVFRFRLMSFTVAGAVAAACGGLSAPWVQIVSPDLSHWLYSAQPMLNTLLGGSALFWGPVIGAFTYAAINYSTRTLAGLSELVIGAILLSIILVAPTGIGGAIVAAWHRVSGRGGSGHGGRL